MNSSPTWDGSIDLSGENFYTRAEHAQAHNRSGIVKRLQVVRSRSASVGLRFEAVSRPRLGDRQHQP